MENRETKILIWANKRETKTKFTLCLSSSDRASILTFAHGTSPGHHGGLVDSLPQPGFPLPLNQKFKFYLTHSYFVKMNFLLLPVENLSISGIKARS